MDFKDEYVRETPWTVESYVWSRGVKIGEFWRNQEGVGMENGIGRIIIKVS